MCWGRSSWRLDRLERICLWRCGASIFSLTQAKLPSWIVPVPQLEILFVLPSKEIQNLMIFKPFFHLYLGPNHHHLSLGQSHSLLTAFSSFTPVLHAIHLLHNSHCISVKMSDPVTCLIRTIQWLHSPQKKSQIRPYRIHTPCHLSDSSPTTLFIVYSTLLCPLTRNPLNIGPPIFL